MTDLLVQLQIVDAERIRELWSLIGVLAAAMMGLIALYAVSVKCKLAEHITKALRWCKAHPVDTCVLAPCAVSLFVYGATKAPIAIPKAEPCDFKQTTATALTEGEVEYWRSQATTNIPVALFGGTVTQELAFAAGDFVYAYDKRTGTAEPQEPTDQDFWVRDSQTNSWTKATRVSVFEDGFNAAVVARMSGSADPKDWRFWFVGPAENCPEIIHEGGVEIVIDREIYTSKSVTIQFHPDGPELKRSPHTYVLQMRRVVDGILLDWKTVMSIQNVGATGGTFIVQGYTVGEYRNYRIYADKEIE